MNERDEIIIELLDSNSEVQKNIELLESNDFNLESEFESENFDGELILDSYYKKDDKLIDLVVVFSNDTASFDKVETLKIKEVYVEKMY